MYQRIFIFVLFFFFNLFFFFLHDCTSTIGNTIGFRQLNDKKKERKNTHTGTQKRKEKKYR